MGVLPGGTPFLISFIFRKTGRSKSIFISVIRETSGLMEKCGGGSVPSEAHGGGWEGLGQDEAEPPLLTITLS